MIKKAIIHCLFSFIKEGYLYQILKQKKVNPTVTLNVKNLKCTSRLLKLLIWVMEGQ
jgi:hypothetical protein